VSAALSHCRSNSPRAFANDGDSKANITFTNCAFLDNVYDTWNCDGGFSDDNMICVFTGSPGAAGVTTVSNVTFKGSTVFKHNSWGALYVASPVTITFEGGVLVADNTKNISNRGDTWGDIDTPQYGAGLHASGGAHLLCLEGAVFR
jgi:hypothetical protein